MNNRIKKKRSCLHGDMYSFKNYHTRRVVVRNERPFVKEVVLAQSAWLFQFSTRWVLHTYPFAGEYIHVYADCLKKRMPIAEAIGRYHEKLRKGDNDV